MRKHLSRSTCIHRWEKKLQRLFSHDFLPDGCLGKSKENLANKKQAFVSHLNQSIPWTREILKQNKDIPKKHVRDSHRENQTNAIFGALLFKLFCKDSSFCQTHKIWSAAKGGLRDGGLRKSEDIWGKRPFSSVFWIPQVLFAPSGKGRKRQKKGEKGRKRAKKADFGRFPGRAARHPLNPHLLHPHLRQPKRSLQKEQKVGPKTRKIHEKRNF